MIKRRIWISYLVILLATLISIGQNTNPFDITNRSEVEPVRGLSVVDTQIVEPQTIIPETIVDPSLVDDQFQEPESSLPSEGNGGISEQESQEELSFIEMQQKRTLQSNPFNVSHIPIKRQKRINKSVEVEKAQREETVLPIESNEGTKVHQSVRTGNSEGANKFIFWLLLLQLLLITSLMGINREFIRKIYRSISNDNFAKLVSRDYNGGYNALFVILYLLFVLSLSVFIYLLFRNLYGLDGFSKYALILFSVIGIYVFRHIFQGFTGYVFPFGKTSSYYNFMIILFNSFLGLILIPLNVLVAYAPSGLSNLALYMGIGAIIIMYLLRFLRGSLHAYTFVRNYLFHFFLYLCTCEFAPVFILVKFLSKSFIN